LLVYLSQPIEEAMNEIKSQALEQEQQQETAEQPRMLTPQEVLAVAGGPTIINGY
jgi:hypothetical protein